jgi:hypothetical protein
MKVSYHIKNYSWINYKRYRNIVPYAYVKPVFWKRVLFGWCGWYCLLKTLYVLLRWTGMDFNVKILFNLHISKSSTTGYANVSGCFVGKWNNALTLDIWGPINIRSRTSTKSVYIFSKSKQYTDSLNILMVMLIRLQRWIVHEQRRYAWVAQIFLRHCAILPESVEIYLQLPDSINYIETLWISCT